MRTRWLLARRNGLARGIFNRLAADVRIPNKHFLTEVRYSLNTLSPSGGYLVFQMVSGSNPADLYGAGGAMTKT